VIIITAASYAAAVKDVIYGIGLKGNARLDRDAWRILIDRNRQYAAVTAEDGAYGSRRPTK